MDTGKGRITRAGRVIELEPRTVDVLLFLLMRPGQLVHHEELLASVWGDIEVTSHSLTQAMSQLRQALGDDPRTPRFIETVHRRGYRWIAPVRVEDRSATLELASRLGPWRLPPSTVTLLGRGTLIGTVGSTLEASRMIVLVGPGGVGKTQLALEVGRQRSAAFPHGSLFVDLRNASDEIGVASALARELRSEPGDRPWLDALLPVLTDREALLVLDNCERVAAEVSAVASRLLSACPGLRILATSQRHLNVPGQVLVPVPPLRMPEPGSTGMDPHDPESWPTSVRLFVARARAVNPGFSVTEANVVAVGEICRRLDGIPFAIELAAARSNVFAPAEIVQRLHERLRLLTAPHPASLSHHEALDQALSWSMSLLSEQTLRLVEELAVFSQGWTLDAAQAVTCRPEGQVLDELSGLVAKSIVTIESSGQQARFELLDSTHVLLKERLARAPDQAAIRSRHLDHFCALARAVEAEISANPLPWLRRVREEHGNIRDAIAFALSSPGRFEAGLRLCCDLRWAWRYQGEYRDPRDWLVQLLSRSQDAPRALAGRAWIVLGLTQFHRGELEDARSSVRRGLDLLPPEEEWERAFGTLLLAFIETMAGDLGQADLLATAAEQAASPDVQLQAFALVRAAVAAGFREQPAEAVRLFSAVVERLRHGGEPFLQAFAQVQLGLQHHLLGDHSRALAAAVEGLRSGLALDNRRVIAGGLEIIGYVELQHGNAGVAGRLLGASARLRATTAAPMQRNFEPHARGARARLESVLGAEKAARCIEEGAGTPLAEILGPLLA